MRYFAVSLIILVLLSACSNSIGNPTASDILKNDADADILQWNDGLVYTNASDFEVLQDKDIKKGEKIGEITRKTRNRWFFKDGAATKLPFGTKIYKTNDDDIYLLIIELENEEIVYHVLLEG